MSTLSQMISCPSDAVGLWVRLQLQTMALRVT